ncbi:cellulase family glycosylhydrolase [Roseimicrobium sp. ORNL1]|uniref:cellulase family glycosylhydrolase n=1 Tax=Roseimicrobium sp. ORNL1 TaxID=2711231 RepID=UPI0013E19E24|nr:cellulase family glycosylhydrolase [Roseimicrobium sp. ORNL1]QIF05195.1 glycoside hydrolase family 5 protein [Roseimicrobium sp. ORNL1]
MNDTPSLTTSMTRRHWLGLAAGTAVSSVAAAADSRASSTPSMHAYPGYGWLRGFSMVPSWGARIEDAWWLYDGARMREEVALAKQVHANCIRLWIEFTAWMADPDKVTAHFMDAVAAIAEQGMKVMPCLFNRWHDNKYDYGGTYTENLRRDHQPQLDYVRALVQPLANDDRILIWDLCNEPQARDLNSEVNKKEYAWLEGITRAVRACGVRQPITIGTMTGSNIEIYAPLMDVLCAHPYSRDKAALEKQITEFKAISESAGKPLLVNECIPGALDDAARADVARYYTDLLSAAGFGWMGWALREGKAISTRRDRYDANGINGEGFHPFFTKEGRLRSGLEFLTQPPTLPAPWQKA